MRLPAPRGSLSEQLFAAMRDDADVPQVAAESEDDLQVTLWALYEQHYRGFDDVDERREWDPALIAVRAGLEAELEHRVRAEAKPLADALDDQDVVRALTTIVTTDTGAPSLTAYLHREATLDQYLEFLVQRSIYHLKESDPHAWAVPRLDGAPKVALAELQYDEFGGGAPDRLHSTLFGDALVGAGLDRTYGAYVDQVPAPTLAVNNVMSLFGLHRRLRGACMGHLAAFEMTSSLPCRRYAQGAQRLELDARVVRYFDEHVEADAVHEQVAARDICQRLADQEPGLREDILLGAAACVQLDEVAGAQMLSAWGDGRSSLSTPAHRAVA